MSGGKIPSGLRTFEAAVAIVTGGASGIGLAICRELVRRGAHVVLADLEYDLAVARASEIAEGVGRASAAAVDVKDFEAVVRVVRAVIAEHGRLDYFFNNAGVAVGGGVHQHSVDDWNHQLDVNIRGVVHGVQAAYPAFREQGFGHLVNTASMAGLLPTPMATSYCTSKYAVVGLSASLRIEAAEFGVRVSVLCPGVIRTAILDGGRHGRMLLSLTEEQRRAAWDVARPMEPDRFAGRALSQVARNRSVIIVPGWWRGLWWCHRLSPSLVAAVAAMIYRRTKRRLDA